MSAATCPLCDRPITDASFCTPCARSLAADLLTAHGLLERPIPKAGVLPACSDLDVTITRQHRVTSNVGGRSVDVPLPWHEKASKIAAHLHAILVSWALLVVEERDVDPPTDATVAMWLTGHVEWLRHHPAGVEAVRELSAAVTAATNVIDRQDRMSLGLCSAPTEAGPCFGDLHARPDEHHVSCRVCGATHDVAQRKQDARDAAEDYLYHARFLASVLDVPESTIRNWHARGQLAAHGFDARSRPLYRVGDVRDLAARRRRTA